MRTLYVAVRVSQDELDSVGIAGLDAQDYLFTTCQDYDVLYKTVIVAMWKDSMPWGIGEISVPESSNMAVLVIEVPDACTAVPTTPIEVVFLLVDILYYSDDTDWEFKLPHQL